ncbi:MAG: Ntn hydrolase family protein [Candidatus Syntropharchaeia archaeon]
MTLGIVVECEDGLLLACDSRTVYGRGVPVQRETNKIFILKKERLQKEQIAVIGAGTVAFMDKFIRMLRDTNLVEIAEEIAENHILSISELVNKVAEPAAHILYEEYVERRKLKEELFSLILAGFEPNGNPDAFILYDVGLAEPFSDFGTIGSGAAYAELFLRNLLPSKRKINDVIKPVCYTIRLVSTMDPYVGGRINLALVNEQGITNISNKTVEISDDIAKESLKQAMEDLRRYINEKTPES